MAKQGDASDTIKIVVNEAPTPGLNSSSDELIKTSDLNSSSSSYTSTSSCVPSSPHSRRTPTTASPSTSEHDEDESDTGPVYNPTTEPNHKSNKSWCPRWPLCKSIQKWRSKAKERSNKPELKFSRQQWFLLFILCTATLTSSFAVCLFPPFFPRVAQEKGCSSTIFGIIIGTNCLISFLVTPVIGRKLQSIGVKFAFIAGLFCSGGCCILSGFLEWFPSGLIFILTAIMIRAVHATANAGVSTSVFAYVGCEFPNTVAQVFAWTRMTMNVAQMFGPVIGGAMLEVGGFKLPFLVMGSIQITMTIPAFLWLPKDKEDEKKVEGCRELSIWKIFTVRGVWVAFFTFIFSTMSNGFLSINLEPQVLRSFGVRSLYIGLLFGLKDGANSIASPLWGWLCDHRRSVKIYIFLSSCFAFTSFLLLGPLPGIPLERTVGLVILSLVFNGVGIGGQQVAGVVDAMREVVDAGFPDGPDTHGCIAGLWASLSGIGRFTSRAGSGIIVDAIGFRNATSIVVALHGIVIVMTLGYLMIWGDLPYGKDKGDEQMRNPQTSRGRFLTTSPNEPLTTKTVNISIPRYVDDYEDSLFCGSAPLSYPTTRYERSKPSSSSNLESI